MEYIGSIQASDDPPGIDKSRWEAVIPTHPQLALKEPEKFRNPFTNKWELSEPDLDVVPCDYRLS